MSNDRILFSENPLAFWLSLFPAASREKPKFSALAEALLRQAADLANITPAIPPAFSAAHAQGNQLDAFGESVRIPRQEGWTDETYRGVLLKKLALYTWDGANETVPSFLDEGETLADAGGNTVTVHVEQSLPLAPSELLPVPLGVRVVSGQ